MKTKQLFQAYCKCLTLAKRNAFKCVIEINANKCDGNQYFSIWIKRFDESFDENKSVSFYSFAPEKYERNIEKVEQLISDSIC